MTHIGADIHTVFTDFARGVQNNIHGHSLFEASSTILSIIIVTKIKHIKQKFKQGWLHGYSTEHLINIVHMVHRLIRD